MRRTIAVALLLSFGVGCCSPDGIRGARERVLKDDLFALRSTIDQYTLDNQKAPQSLDDLVKAGYLRQVPKDPMTGKPDWEAGQCETYLSMDKAQTGICDVHSASQDKGCDGTSYRSW